MNETTVSEEAKSGITTSPSHLRETVGTLIGQLHRTSQTQRNCLDNLRGSAPYATDGGDDEVSNDLESLIGQAQVLACRVDSQASEISQKIGGNDEALADQPVR